MFVGYAPYKNPRYSISVIVEHGGAGSRKAAPIARDIMQKALSLGQNSYGPIHNRKRSKLDNLKKEANMSILINAYQNVPTGFRKVLYFHWPLALLLTAVSCIGFLMLFSVSGGNFDQWAKPQIIRFCIGFVAMIIIGFTPISIWRNISIPTYIISLALLLYVEYFGVTGKRRPALDRSWLYKITAKRIDENSFSYGYCPILRLVR